MPRSKAKRASGGSRRGGGAKPSRWQTFGLFVTLLAVAALVGSLAFGVWQHFRDPGPTAPPAAPASGARPVPASASAPVGRVRVQVLNATTTRGLAAEARRVLRDHGFDVVEMGNAPRGTPPRSIVIDRVGNPEQARLAADALGITPVETRRDPTLVLEVTVVLGSDWRGVPR